jgi:hypothetical protein
LDDLFVREMLGLAQFSLSSSWRSSIPAIAEVVAQERLATTTSELAALRRALSDSPDREEMRKRLDGLIQRTAVKAG